MNEMENIAFDGQYFIKAEKVQSTKRLMHGCYTFSRSTFYNFPGTNWQISQSVSHCLC